MIHHVPHKGQARVIWMYPCPEADPAAQVASGKSLPELGLTQVPRAPPGALQHLIPRDATLCPLCMP